MLSSHNIFRRATVRTVAHHHQFRGNLFAHPREDLNDIRDSLHRPEIREVHQDWFAVLGPLLARCLVLATFVKIAIHEIRNYFDGPLDLEFLNGSFA